MLWNVVVWRKGRAVSQGCVVCGTQQQQQRQREAAVCVRACRRGEENERGEPALAVRLSALRAWPARGHNE